MQPLRDRSACSVTLLLWALLGLGLVGASACSAAWGGSPLANAQRSPEELAGAALLALAASDSEGLDALRINREEYEAFLWPSLPDKAHVPFDFVWSLTGPRSRKARREVVSEYGGLPLELVKVELGQKREVYEDFTLYQEARMTVRNTETGVEGLIPLMDVIVEMGGRWKFLNFGEDL